MSAESRILRLRDLLLCRLEIAVLMASVPSKSFNENMADMKVRGNKERNDAAVNF